jgi:hypothetical protein
LRTLPLCIRPPPSSQNNADPPPNRGRTSPNYQRNTRSSWSSIGTQRGLGPEPLAALP